MIRDLLHRAWIGLTRNVAFTSPSAEDERLRGRTYAIPFELVWTSALTLVEGGLKGWQLLEQDDREGIIRGLSGGRVERLASAITVRVTLDQDAQTRVDGLAASRFGRSDFGRNARRLDLFFTSLDAMLSEARGRSIEAFRLERSIGPPVERQADPEARSDRHAMDATRA